jgi:hypothetical protein
MASANAETTREEFRSDRILVGADQPVSFPLLAQLLASIAARIEPRKPVCVVLPSTEYLAELTALVLSLRWLEPDCRELAGQASQLIFVPGGRVRSLIGGYVL